VQIDQHLDPALPDNNPLTRRLQPLILVPPLLAQSLLDRDLLRGTDLKDFSRALHQLRKTLCRLLLGNLFRRRILGNM